MESIKYSIVVPAYNEGARIRVGLEQILAYLGHRRTKAEIIVVNDGSTDNTSEIVSEYADKGYDVRLLENTRNRGKGYSVRTGMLYARGDVLLFTDADLSSPIIEAEKLFAAIASGADVAIGSRWLERARQIERQPIHRQLFGRVFNLAMRQILGLKFKDTQCGFKAFTRSAAKTLFSLQRIEKWGFDPELLFLAKEHSLSVREIPVEWSHRGGSRINVLGDGIRMFTDVLRIRWNSLRGLYSRANSDPPRRQFTHAESTDPREDLGQTMELSVTREDLNR